MNNAYSNFASSLDTTPVSRPIVGRSDMVQNNAGGFVFSLSPFDFLDRFLILGTTESTYYASARKLTEDGATKVIDLIKVNGVGVVNRVVEISDAGRAPKNDAALFTLALVIAYGDADARNAAFAAIPKVARTGTHLLHLASYVNGLRGWGRGVRRAFSAWYTERKPENLAMQLVKYANRDGWTHKDVLRLCHASPKNAEQNALFALVTGKDVSFKNTSINEFMDAVLTLKGETNAAKAAKLIADFKLPREVVPTQMLNDPNIWSALLPHMGLTAVIRNLGKMTNVGVIKTFSNAEKDIAARLLDVEQLRAQRIHPVSALVALRTYSNGRGVKGDNTWTPSSRISSALEDAFYLSFQTVEPTNKNTLLAVDVSGSMGWGNIAGLPMTPKEGAAAMAMVAVRTEPNVVVTAFSHKLTPVNKITNKTDLQSAIRILEDIPMGGTDCSLPIQYAYNNKIPVESFAVYTDNETWFGAHPATTLKAFRRTMDIPAKLAVVGMTATNFTIADPTDRGMLDVVGFDTAAPALMADFFRN
jgi:60 kDa SS-A/Ro ribonucleoprotein